MCCERIFLLRKHVALSICVSYKSDTYRAWAGSEAGEHLENISVSSPQLIITMLKVRPNESLLILKHLVINSLYELNMCSVDFLCCLVALISAELV